MSGLLQVKEDWFQLTDMDGIEMGHVLLLGKVYTLSFNDHNGCYASNDTFARMFNVSKRTVQRWIEALIEKGFLKKYEGDDVPFASHRFLFVQEDMIEEMVGRGVSPVSPPVTRMSPPPDTGVTQV